MQHVDTEQPDGTTTSSPARWVAMAAYAALIMAGSLCYLSYASVTSSVSGDFGVSEASVANLVLLSPAFLVLLGPLSGRWLDRRLEGTLLLGAALTALGALVRAVDARSYVWALVGGVLITAGTPFVLNAITKYPARYFSAKERPGVIALLSASMFGGVLLAALTAQPLYNAGGVELLTLVHGIAAAAAAAGVVTTVICIPSNPGNADPDVVVPTQPLRRTRELWLLATLAFVALGLFNAFAAWIETIEDKLGNAGLGGPLVVALTLGGITGAMAVHGPAARYDVRRSVLVVATIAQLAALVAIATLSGSVVLVVLAGVLGFFMVAGTPIALEWSELHVGEAHAASAMAFLGVVGNIGGFVFVIVPEIFVDRPRAMLASLAVLALPAVVAAVRLPRTPTLDTGEARVG